MSARTQVPVEEYLRTSFEGPDPEYLDGEIVERGLLNLPHSNAQRNLIFWFVGLDQKFSLSCFPELHLRVAERRYRIADIAVFKGRPAEGIPSSPPFVAIEILSPDDRFADVLAKLAEYRAWGVAHVWLVDPINQKLYTYTAGLSEVPALRLPEYEVEIAASATFS